MQGMNSRDDKTAGVHRN